MIHRGVVLAAALVAGPLGAQGVAARITDRADRDLLTALIAVEDSRDTVKAENDPRMRGMSSGNAYLRAFTYRGLGRLEQPAMLRWISRGLADPVAEVRIAAADAAAQAVARVVPAGAPAETRLAWNAAVNQARSVLVTRLAVEGQHAVRGALFEAIGRLNQGALDHVRSTAGIIAPGLGVPDIAERRGAIRGLFFLARKREARTPGAIPVEVTDRLYAMLTAPASDLSSLDRSNIAFLLAGAAALSDVRMKELSRDADPAVRDRAVTALARAADTATVRTVVMAGLSDRAPVVRYRSVLAYAQRLRAADGCASLTPLVGDADVTVALAAADALSGCRGDAMVVRMLDSLAGRPLGEGSWHLPAHAFVSLAVVDPAKARALMPRYAVSPDFYVRMYADTAARLMADTAALYRFARDPHPNVRSTAIDALARLVGHAADSTFVTALSSDDNQLLMSASNALRGSTLPGVRQRAIDALARLRRLGRETTRDGEEALLTLIRSFGEYADAGAPPRSRSPLPAFADLAALERAEATIEMMDGAVIRLRFHPFDAPTNVARFARLARAGTFNGLTFHRVAPFFVVQGPGPFANEYSAPDAPFARDELGVSNVRGTVGLSTRGRDTADGQVYVNTVDNIWLDHEYTVMATITSGLEAFDRMQEGARIRRVTIRD